MHAHDRGDRIALVGHLRLTQRLASTHIARPDRRDRVLFITAIAVALLTLLGAAGESLGMERLLKANTVKRRTYSLFRQGVLYYLKIPTMRHAECLSVHDPGRSMRGWLSAHGGDLLLDS